MKVLSLVFLAILAIGCSTMKDVDYTNFREAKPKSILILPPMNHSIDVTASTDYLSVISRPVVEQGYYVFPVAVVERFFRAEGATDPADIHQVPLTKINEYFEPDAVFYLEVHEWSSDFKLIAAETHIQVKGTLVDAKTAKVLWQGQHEKVVSDSDSNAGVLGMIVNAAIAQIVNDVSDRPKTIAKDSVRKVFAGKNGFLVGDLFPRDKKQVAKL